MRLLIYDLAYSLENYDEGNFKELEYEENIANIISCFLENDYMVLFPIEEKFFNNDKYLINRGFIKDRAVFVNKEWIYNIPVKDNNYPNIIWYRTTNKEELIEVISNDLCFNCVIIKPEDDIKESIYILNSNEDEEFNSLTIREKNKGDFLIKVLPKLQQLLRNRLEILDLR